MIRIKNVSLEMRTVPSIAGAYDIAPGGITGDLTAYVDGQRVNTFVDLEQSDDLDAAIRSGHWVGVDDDGNELGLDASLAMVQTASIEQARTFDGRIQQDWTLIDPNPASNTDFDALEIPIAAATVAAVDLKLFLVVGPQADITVGSVPWSFCSRRNLVGDVRTPGFGRLKQSERGIKFRIDDRASSVVIQARRRGTDPVWVRYTGTVRTLEIPA